jgi:selenocysteine-specific elongation factor
MLVIGTAGHVDHGKSALVQALTGIDPDRLREEKERGLTIDLGFAWFELDGQEVSIVDVPGHERFIKNMLAGVGGIDLALLVIAADEGVMPQTREHLEILDLLGVTHGVVAVTKADLVEPDFVELATADAEDVLKGTTLEGAPVIACSAKTRSGLNDLKAALAEALRSAPGRRDIGRPRLPIDRAFTIAGFGTVVTGTLIDGAIATGEEVEIVPGGIRSRIRGLQAHGRSIDVAPPGRRTAVNLASVSVAELQRGMIVTKPGAIRPSTSFDVRFRAVRYLGRTIRHNLEVTFHTGSAEAGARLLLLDAERLNPGEEAWVQLRLDQPVAAIRGDHFIIRDPNDTLGGGIIVDANVKRHRRFHAATIAELESLAEGSPEELVLSAASRMEPAELGDLAKDCGLNQLSAHETISTLIEDGRLVALSGSGKDTSILYTEAGFSRLTASLREALTAYHRQSPLRTGMPREELRSRLGLAARVFDPAIGLWESLGDAKQIGTSIALPSHEPSLDERQLAQAKAYVEALGVHPYAPAPESTPDDDVLAFLEARGEIVRAGEGIAFATEAYARMVAAVTNHIEAKGAITLAEVRDLLDTSRKYAQALMEHLDSERITRRVGDARVLRNSGAGGE